MYKKHNYWVDPKGNVLASGIHNAWANNWIRDNEGFEKSEKVLTEYDSATDYLQELGWIRIVHWDSMDNPLVVEHGIIKANSIQKKSIQRFSAEKGFNVNWEIPEKWYD